MLPYATKWSCARVRVMMWQQIAPFIKEEEKQRDTPLGALLRAACPAEGQTQGQGQGRGYATHHTLHHLHCIALLIFVTSAAVNSHSKDTSFRLIFFMFPYLILPNVNMKFGQSTTPICLLLNFLFVSFIY